MDKKNNVFVSDKRLLTWSEGCSYTGLGRSYFRTWSESIGAVIKLGKRVLFDKDVIDRMIDAAHLSTI